MTFVEASLI